MSAHRILLFAFIAMFLVLLAPSLVSAAMSTSPDWGVAEDQDSCHFAESVATAGDVNGDGYDDVAVGVIGHSLSIHGIREWIGRKL